jgi:hypothetical protein
MRKEYIKSPLVIEGWMEAIVMPECSEIYDENRALKEKACVTFWLMLFDTERDKAMRKYFTPKDVVRLIRYLIDNLEIEGEVPDAPLWRKMKEWLDALKEVNRKYEVPLGDEL